MKSTGFPALSGTCAAALFLSAAALLFSGCATSPERVPDTSQGFIERTYQIPVAVPGLAGRFDKGRPIASQQVIVRLGQPATFRASIDVRRASPNAELKGFARGKELFSIPAIRMNPGDPSIPVRVALPVGGRSQIMDLQIRLQPGTADAAFDVNDVSITIGETPPEELKVEDHSAPAPTIPAPAAPPPQVK